MAHTAAPGAPVPSGMTAGIPLLAAVEGLAKALFAAFIFFACFAFSETSPYDAVAIPTIVLWLCLGVRLHRGTVPQLALLLLYLAAIVTALELNSHLHLPSPYTASLPSLPPCPPCPRRHRLPSPTPPPAAARPAMRRLR